MGLGGQRHAPATLPPEKRSGTHCHNSVYSVKNFSIDVHRHKASINAESGLLEVGYNTVA